MFGMLFIKISHSCAFKQTHDATGLHMYGENITVHHFLYLLCYDRVTEFYQDEVTGLW